MPPSPSRRSSPPSATGPGCHHPPLCQSLPWMARSTIDAAPKPSWSAIFAHAGRLFSATYCWTEHHHHLRQPEMPLPAILPITEMPPPCPLTPLQPPTIMPSPCCAHHQPDPPLLPPSSLLCATINADHPLPRHHHRRRMLLLAPSSLATPSFHHATILLFVTMIGHHHHS